MPASGPYTHKSRQGERSQVTLSARQRKVERPTAPPKSRVRRHAVLCFSKQSKEDIPQGAEAANPISGPWTASTSDQEGRYL